MKGLYSLFLIVSVLALTGCASTYRVPVFSGTGDRVIMIHGLGASAAQFRPIEEALEEQGFDVIRCEYPSTRYGIRELSGELFSRIVNVLGEGDQKIHFVTHSMGSLLLRVHLEENEFENLGRVVMIAPPNQGSEIIDYYRDNSFFARFSGPAVLEMGTSQDDLPRSLGPVDFSPVIIAGTRSGNRHYSRIIPGVDDGRVSVNSCAVEGMEKLIKVDSTHEEMLYDERVIEIVVKILSQSR